MTTKKDTNNHGVYTSETTTTYLFDKKVDHLDLKDFIERERMLQRTASKLPRTSFTDAFNDVYEIYEWTEEEIEEITGLCVSTISKYKRGKKPSESSLRLICVGMQVDSEICLVLFELCGYDLVHGPDNQIAYRLMQHPGLYEFQDVRDLL